MTVHVGSGLSSHPDARTGALEAAGRAADQLGDRPADLAVVFSSGEHLSEPQATLDAVHEALAPAQLIGCGAGGVIGAARELESDTGVVVWAASLGEGSAQAFGIEVETVPGGVALSGFPNLTGAAGVILLADPTSFPTDAILGEVHRRAPGVPLVGGLASAPGSDGRMMLFVDDHVQSGGGAAVRLDGLEVLPCVSQGAAPLGPEMTITAAEGHEIQELAGQPALARLQDAVAELDAHERALVSGGVLLGIVIDPDKPEYQQGDFLVRGMLGADQDSGTITVGTAVHAGQVVRLHARDAACADRDLCEALDLRVRALGGQPPAGALLFSCNGRGVGMFGVRGHDAEALEQRLSGAPTAGFFAAGEIGPVGGQSFLHGFTATMAIFPP
jgi:small ligand-binding sensory domain FIST